MCYSYSMLEIERKFLVSRISFDKLLSEQKLRHNYNITQGYLVNTDKVCVRVRIEDHMVPGPNRIRAVLAIKQNVGDSMLVRTEGQFDIPVETAHDILYSVQTLSKSRFEYDGYDVDAFLLDLTGLYVAEKEYPSEEAAHADTMPSWAYAEVTNDPAYTNNNLIGKEFVNGKLK